MKKMLAWLLSLSMLLTMIPAVSAEGEDAVFTVDETEYSYADDSSGDGWSYDAEMMALTLDGIEEGNIDLSSAPDGVCIILAPGSENELVYLDLPWSGYEEDAGVFVPVSGEGSLYCGNSSVYGSLQIDSGTVEIEWMTGALLVNGGNVTVDRIKAAPSVVVNGGSLDINALDTYAFEQYGGTVRASTMSNCNGTDLDCMNYVLAGGSFILDDSGEEYVCDMGAFFCLVWEAASWKFEWEFENFANNLVGEDGKPLKVVIYGYDEDGELIENPRWYEGMCHAVLRNSDGTPAHYAEYRPTFVVGEDTYSCNEDASGDGWSYDAESLTMTLDGIEMVTDPDDYSESYGIDLSNAPKGTQIVLAPGSENAVNSVTVSEDENYITPISGEGTLTTRTYGGFLCLNSGSVYSGAVYGPLVVNGGNITTTGLVYGDFTINGGTADLKGTKASETFIVNGGDLTINELDAYTYEQYGGTVRAVRMSNCNGTPVSSMKYVLAGGTLILDNSAQEYEKSAFGCAASHGSNPDELRQTLAPFGKNMVDAEGDPLVLRISGYDEDWNETEDLPAGYSGLLYAELFNADGTPARYAEYHSIAPCDHEASWLRSDDDGHWYVCGNCGGDMEDTRTAHEYTAYGPVNYCDCGHLTTELELYSEDSSIKNADLTGEIVQLGLKMWLGEAKMAYQIRNTIDYDWEGITLEKIARLQLLAQGSEVPEHFAVFGMTYNEGKGEDAFASPDDVSGSWDTAKVFVLDPVTLAPLTAPIVISK